MLGLACAHLAHSQSIAGSYKTPIHYAPDINEQENQPVSKLTARDPPRLVREFKKPQSPHRLRLCYCDVGLAGLSKVDAIRPDLLVVVGGPIGASEDESHPLPPNEVR